MNTNVIDFPAKPKDTTAPGWLTVMISDELGISDLARRLEKGGLCIGNDPVTGVHVIKKLPDGAA